MKEANRASMFLLLIWVGIMMILIGTSKYNRVEHEVDESQSTVDTTVVIIKNNH